MAGNKWFYYDTKKATQDMKDIKARFPKILAAAAYPEMAVEMREMIMRTPVWNPERPVPKGHAPGSLRASGRLHPPDVTNERIIFTFSFGNQNVDYALYVHEDPDAFHATGEWNFMRGVLHQSGPFLPARIARHMTGDFLTMPYAVEVLEWQE
jgi:hypothetical protein